MSDREMVTADGTLALVRVSLVLCTACLHGAGGECHTPGCALWMNRAPDVPIVDKCDSHGYADGQVCDADDREVGRCDQTDAKDAGAEVNLAETRSHGTPGMADAPAMSAAERHAHPLLAGLLEAERMLRGGT